VPQSVDLSCVRLKLDRANKHIECFRLNLEAFLKQDPAPFGFRPEERPGAGEAVEHILYAVVRKHPPRELALLIGDAIQNMRTALEYLAYELSSPRARKSGNTSFPIFSDECEFKVKGLPRIKTIKGDERTFIERVQPYAASKVPSDDPLAILRRLSNLDKHQLLVPIIAAVNERESWVASDNAEIRFRFIRRGPVVHDAEIVIFTATPKDPAVDMNVQPQSGLQVQIAENGIKTFQIDALELLQMIEHHIRFIIEMWFDRGFMPKTWKEIEAIS
jgi:hypothetical protein